MRKRPDIRTTDSLRQQTDAELLRACLEGEPAAWEGLIVRYQRLIYSIPIKMGLSSNDAADVFQSVCVKLLEGLFSLRDLEKISAWLTTTTKRECWRVASGRRREHVAFVLEGSANPNESIHQADASPLAHQQQEALEQQQILRAAVDALPEPCRNLITMLFYDESELSYAEIARRMNMPVNSMGPTRARCLSKLKKLLEGKL